MATRGRPKGSPQSGGLPKKIINWPEFEAACACWCTIEELCHIFNTTNKTLDLACRRQYGKSFHDVYVEKSCGGKRALRRTQLTTALKGNPAMLIWLGKQKLGQHEPTQAVEHTGKDGGAVKMDISINYFRPDDKNKSA